MSKIIDGKAVSQEIKEGLRTEVAEAEARFGRAPMLAVIIVGDDPASRSYVRGKVKASEFVGMDSRLIELPVTVAQDELLAKVRELNADDAVDAILVQLPLPEHIDADAVIDAIAVEKDVDGFHPRNVAALQLGRPGMIPCTPRGIIRLIESTGTKISGKRAVVVGRSNIVGKPTAKLLMDNGATVTVAHTKTADLKSVTRDADILVSATGSPRLIKKDMVKPGAVVIDVGISRQADGTLCGDVDFAEVSQVASFITPVPGGVGPMTITMLMDNTLRCFLSRHEK